MEQSHRNIESTPDTFSRTLEDGASSSEDARAHFNKLYNHTGGGGLYGDDDLNEPVYLESIASKALVSVRCSLLGDILVRAYNHANNSDDIGLYGQPRAMACPYEKPPLPNQPHGRHEARMGSGPKQDPQVRRNNPV